MATPAHRFQLAKCDAQFGLIHLHAKEFADASAAFTEANGVLQALLDAGFDPPACKFDISTNLANIAYCEQESGRLDDSLATLMGVITLREELVRDSPQTALYQRRLATALDNMREGGALYVEKMAPAPSAKTPASKLEHERARSAAWHTLAMQYPNIADFKDKAVISLLRVAGLEAAPLAGMTGALTIEDQKRRAECVGRALAAVTPSICVQRVVPVRVSYTRICSSSAL